MKHIIIFIFLFLLVACEDRPQWKCRGNNNSAQFLSIAPDERCEKIQANILEKVKKKGVCDPRVGFAEAERKRVTTDFQLSYNYYLTPEKCLYYFVEVRKNPETFNKKKQNEACALKPDFAEATRRRIRWRFDPDYKYYLTPEKCKAYWAEAGKECIALPYDESRECLGCTDMYTNGKPVGVDFTKVAQCKKIYAETKAKGTGVCYSGPLTFGLDEEAKHPNPEKCKNLWLTARKKCRDLPTVNIEPTIIDGKLVCL